MKKSYESPDCKIVVTTTDFDLLQISAEKDDPNMVERITSLSQTLLVMKKTMTQKERKVGIK